MKIRIRLFAVLLSAGLTLSCGKSRDADKETPSAFDSDTAVSLLRHVPADSPYLIATLKPWDEDIRPKFESMTDKVLRAYRELLRVALDNNENQENSEKRNKLERARPVLEEIYKAMSIEGLRDIGLEFNTTSAIYGVGLLPVARLNVADAEKLEATMARIEEKAGRQLQTSEIGGQSFRFVGDEKLRLILATIGEQLVITLVPTGASEETTGAALGLVAPAKSMVDADTLSDLAAKEHYLPNNIGYVDTVRIVDTFLDRQSGVNEELLKLMRYDAAGVTDICRTELKDMARVVPKLSFGMTRIDTEQIDVKFVIEVRPDIAGTMQGLAAPVPGIGGDMGGVFSYGFGFDLKAARQFIEERVRAIESDPYECEYFADLQADIESARQFLNQPIPPIAYNLKGAVFHVDAIDGFDFSAGSIPDSLAMRALVAIDNAPQLLLMGQSFFPPLADLELEPNGESLQLPTEMIPWTNNPIYVAMSDNAVAVGTGDEAKKLLPAMLTADSPGNPPIHSFSYDIGAYMNLIASVIQAAAANQDAGELPVDAFRDVFEVLGESMDRFWMNVELTEQGIEVPYSLTLK